MLRDLIKEGSLEIGCHVGFHKDLSEYASKGRMRGTDCKKRNVDGASVGVWALSKWHWLIVHVCQSGVRHGGLNPRHDLLAFQEVMIGIQVPAY